MVTIYDLYDVVEGVKVDTVTLQQAKEFLVDLWSSNSEEMSQDVYDSLVSDIGASDEDELFDFLVGMGYAIHKAE